MTLFRNNCPPDADLISLLSSTTDELVEAYLEQHLSDCDACRDRLQNLTDVQWKDLLSGSPNAGSPDATGSIHAGDTPPEALQANFPNLMEGSSGIPRRVPRELPGLELLDQIGQGGMATVYRARQIELNRIVAVKLIEKTVTQSDRWIRFRNEAQSAAQLQHENIVTVFDTGFAADYCWIVQEYCDGGTLLDRVRDAPLTGMEAARTILQLADAVHHAHHTGIIHRDIKPANVLFSGVTPRLADFGVARQLDGEGVTQTGEAIGTPGYMSPEQALGASGNAGPAADIYGLGALLYESLTGVPPFRAPTAVETLRMVVEQDPIAPRRLQPSVPRDLEIVCLKCLEKEPGRRYASAQDLRDDLMRFLNGHPITARPCSALRKLVRWIQRNRAAAGLVMTLVASVMTFLAVWANLTWQLKETNTQLTDQAIALSRKTLEAEQNEQEARDNLEAQVAANAALQEVLDFFTSDLFDAATSDQQGVNLTVLEVLDQADEKIKQRTPDRPRVEAPLRLAIGNTLELVGQSRKAVEHLERADELFRTFDPHSTTAFDCRQVLARCLAGTGDRQRALALAQELTSSEWQPTPVQAIRLRHDLLRFDSVKRTTEETVELLGQLHADCVEQLGARNIVTLSIVSAIATELFRAGRFEEALEIFRTDLAETEQELGLDHVNTYNAANNVAVALVRLGRLDEAELIQRENLRRQMMFRGPRDAGTAGTMHNLAMVLWRQNKRHEAVELLKEVVNGRAAALGPVERRTLESLYQIGRMFDEMKASEEGYSFLEEHFWVYAEAARSTREWVDLFNVFATLAVAAGAYDDAESSIQHAHQLLERMGTGFMSQRNALKSAEAALERAKAE